MITTTPFCSFGSFWRTQESKSPYRYRASWGPSSGGSSSSRRSSCSEPTSQTQPRPRPRSSPRRRNTETVVEIRKQAVKTCWKIEPLEDKKKRVTKQIKITYSSFDLIGCHLLILNVNLAAVQVDRLPSQRVHPLNQGQTRDRIIPHLYVVPAEIERGVIYLQKPVGYHVR